MKIIPAIDLIDGKCVRLSQGDYDTKKVYNENPLDVALEFEDLGITRLHMVDLDGAKAGQVINLKVLETIASKTSLKIDFGGGIKSDQSITDVFNAGAIMASIGSVAVKNPELFESWLLAYGGDKIYLGADVKDEKIFVSGWLEGTDQNIFDFLKHWQSKGLKHYFCTDIAKDGLLQGPSVELYQKLIQEFPKLNLTASGGIASAEDLDKLAEIGCDGAITGKAIYEKRISLEELKIKNEELAK